LSFIDFVYITLTEAGRNLGPGFGQGEKRGGVKPVNGTSIPFIIWRFPLANVIFVFASLMFDK
jgi:hypothetical protein